MKNTKLIGFFILTIIVSSLISYFVAKSQSNIRFVAEPRPDNPDYGYLQVDGKRYLQLYTTTQVNIGNGLHYHRIDIRASEPTK
jgi:hypothetical protein